MDWKDWLTGSGIERSIATGLVGSCREITSLNPSKLGTGECKGGSWMSSSLGTGCLTFKDFFISTGIEPLETLVFK